MRPKHLVARILKFTVQQNNFHQIIDARGLLFEMPKKAPTAERDAERKASMVAGNWSAEVSLSSAD